jgi:phosphatidylserine synthase
MYCNQCGSRLSGGEMHCPHCGKAVGPAGVPPAMGVPVAARPLNPAQGRVLRHRNILAILWLVRATILLIPGMALVGLSHVHRWPWPTGMPGFFMPFLGGLGLGILLLAGAEYAAGIGLLTIQPWARLLAIITGVVELISFPIGTALGVYSLWVLLPQISETEYQQLAREQAAGQFQR